MKLALDSRIDGVLHFACVGAVVSHNSPQIALDAPRGLLPDTAAA